MAVKKKVKLSKKGFLVLFCFAFLVISISVPMTISFFEKSELRKLDYSEEAIRTIQKNHLKDYIVEKGKNETLNEVLSSSDYQNSRLEEYEKIGYQEQDNFTKHINQLLDKGYSTEEVNHILRTGTDSDVASFLEKDYISDILDFLSLDYAKLANYDRYVAYQKEEYTTEEETVLRVNIGLDQPFYENADVITEFSIDVLTNKYHQLGENYIPDDLVSISEEYSLNPDQKMAKVARDAFEEMARAAEKDGMIIKARSSYRSYQDQLNIYQEYEEKYGTKGADGIAARAGFSEHQTGLVVDVGADETSVFANTKEFQWMKEHAHEYGYILRYPKGKEDITGYNYEAWHYRYVGEEIAQYIKKNNITFDEYYVMFLD